MSPSPRAAAEAGLQGAEQAVWLNRLEVEHDNLRAALEWSIAEGSRQKAVGSPTSDARLPSADTPSGLPTAYSPTCQRGDYATARAMYAEGLVGSRRLGNQEWEATNLQNLGDVAWLQGDHASARTLYTESLTIRRALGDRKGVAASLGNMGNVAREQGETTAARALYEEALAAHREMGDRLWEAINLGDLGELALRQEEHATAYALFAESLGIRWELKDRWGIANSLNSLANLACAQGEHQRAAQLFGAAEVTREAIGAPLSPIEAVEYERNVAALRAGCDRELFAAAWAEGRAMPLEQSVRVALGEDELPTTGRQGS